MVVQKGKSMKRSRISPPTTLAIVIYCLGSDLRKLLFTRIGWRSSPVSISRALAPQAATASAKHLAFGTTTRAQNASRAIHKTLNTRSIRLHSPQALAGFTILTAFLVWLTLRSVPIRTGDLDLLLPAVKSSSKLKEDKAPGAEVPVPLPPANDSSRHDDSPGDPGMAPPAIEPAAAERRQTELSSDAQPGEATMINQLKNGMLHTALLGWLFSAPLLPAFADDKPAPGETADRLGKIDRAVDDLKIQVQKLQESVKTIKETDYLKPIRDDVAQLKTDVARLQQDPPTKFEARKPPVPAIPGENRLGDTPQDIAERVRRLEFAMENMPLTVQAHSRDLVQMRQELDNLHRDVTRLQQDLERERTRITRYPPAATEGKIQLVNQWFEAKTVIVDGVAYRLAPGETRIINKPAGTFHYEVIGVTQPGLTRTVTAGETYNIRIGAPQG
jgi:hypothetical protein